MGFEDLQITGLQLTIKFSPAVQKGETYHKVISPGRMANATLTSLRTLEPNDVPATAATVPQARWIKPKEYQFGESCMKGVDKLWWL